MAKIIGTANSEYFYGTQGQDTIEGLGGNDVIWGTPIPNTTTSVYAQMAFYITDGADLLSGGDGNDVLFGFGGADTLLGGTGADTLEPGTGVDLLTGGAGADVFEFILYHSAPEVRISDTGVGAGNRDVVTDFSQGFNSDVLGIHFGADKINLRYWENWDDGGIRGAVFTGNSDSYAFAVDTNQLHVGYHYENSRAGELTIIDLHIRMLSTIPSGIDPHPEIGPTGQIELRGHFDLTASDFIF